MTKITVTKVLSSRYEYEGYIAEGVDESKKVYGEFSIEWDDDIPEVYASPNVTDIDGLEVADIDLDFVSQQIAAKGDESSWYEDRLSNASDYDWDMER